MLPSRSLFAFECNAIELFKHNEHVYFWTLTFVKVPWCDTIALKRWNNLIVALRWHHPFLKGMRVIELHASHGLHFHLIVNERIPVDLMRRLSSRWGFGRVSVSHADIGSVTYLSKYLTKSFSEKNPTFAGRRRWGMIGMKGTRCKDLVYETDYTRNRELLFKNKQIGYAEHRLTAAFSHLFGSFNDWPVSIKIRYQQAMQSYGHKQNFL